MNVKRECCLYTRQGRFIMGDPRRKRGHARTENRSFVRPSGRLPAERGPTSAANLSREYLCRTFATGASRAARRFAAKTGRRHVTSRQDIRRLFAVPVRDASHGRQLAAPYRRTQRLRRVGSGGSKAARIASSKTFFSPFCKTEERQPA